MEIRCVGVDIDDTVSGSLEKVLSILNNHFGKSLTRDDITVYSYEEYFGPSAWDVYTEHVNDIHLGSKPLEDSINVLNRLAESGIHIEYITARRDTANATTIAWLQKHKYPNHLNVWHESQKGKLCKFLQVDVMVDDSPEKALDIANHGIQVLLVDMPYNRDIKHENITRVHSWKEIDEWFKKNGR